MTGFDGGTVELKKMLDSMKQRVQGYDSRYEKWKMTRYRVSDSLTPEHLQKLWVPEDKAWDDFKKSLVAVKLRNHQLIDELINTHGYITQLRDRERKLVLFKINKNRNKDEEEEEERENKDTSDTSRDHFLVPCCSTKRRNRGEVDIQDQHKDASILDDASCSPSKKRKEDTKPDSQDASNEKAYENIETRKTDASAGILLDTVCDDQPVSRGIDGTYSSIPIHSPGGHENNGVDASAAIVVESAQMKEATSPTISGTKSLEKDQEPLKQDKLHTESQEQGRTISINTENPVQDSQDSSNQKADENMETRETNASAGKLLDIVCDDQPLSIGIDGMYSPIPIHSPASEKQPEADTCDMNTENLPFVKRTPLWHAIEAMEIFQKIPQNPHFRPLLEGVKESAREGLAIGTMVTFSTVVNRINRLRFEDPRSSIEDYLETLVELESNGFNVGVIRDSLTRLLLLKVQQEELEDWSKKVVEKIEEHKIQENTIGDEVDEIDRQIRQLEEARRKALLKKEEWKLEVDAMKATEVAIEQEIIQVAAEFDGLAAAPF